MEMPYRINTVVILVMVCQEVTNHFSVHVFRASDHYAMNNESCKNFFFFLLILSQYQWGFIQVFICIMEHNRITLTIVITIVLL